MTHPIYSDVNNSSPRDHAVVQEVDSIRQALDTLFETLPGENLFNVGYGFAAQAQLFELMDDAGSLALLSAIVGSIQRWEKRVKINLTQTVITPVPDDNRYDLFLVFSIRGVSGQSFVYKRSFNQSG